MKIRTVTPLDRLVLTRRVRGVLAQHSVLCYSLQWWTRWSRCKAYVSQLILSLQLQYPQNTGQRLDRIATQCQQQKCPS
jgi:hypothetical protein